MRSQTGLPDPDPPWPTKRLCDSPFKFFVDLVAKANYVLPVLLAVGRVGGFIWEQGQKGTESHSEEEAGRCHLSWAR